MNFIKYDLGPVAGGNKVRVTLDIQANVMLMDRMNFSLYNDSLAFKYFGGYYKSSPVTIDVPDTDHWYVIIDLGGAAGPVKTTCSVIS
ncbi:DUF1883 domain-containing protein [Propionispira raffinosivorans]|uniref:DUF1883 domain-containing protein n=1 Tax=Propionispira raffinosivorans TaxID=86959 RepID=UPI000363BB36|nr:DUF1883 domain-containing protein [Propionispira raffinosivorans]